MIYTLIVIGILVVPIVIFTLLKVNAVFVYLSLCLGEVLSIYVGNNSSINNLVSTRKIVGYSVGSGSDVKIGLLLIPVILTTIFMLGTARGSKLSLNIIPSIAVGLLAIFLVIPILPFSTASSIANTTIWTHLNDYKSSIIGISSALVLLMLLAKRPATGRASGSHKHHKG
jgi:hypothetical protein